MESFISLSDFVGKLDELKDETFLALLTRRAVELRLEEGQLRVSAPPGVLDAEVRDELKRRKANLLVLLAKKSSEASTDSRKSDLGVRARKRVSPAGQWTPQLQYWKTQLEGAPEFVGLPFSNLRRAKQTGRTESFSFEIPPILLPTLKNDGLAAEVSFETVLLTAFSLLIYRYTDSIDFCIGLPVRRRQRHTDPITEGTVENTVALRSQINARWTFEEFFGFVSEAVKRAYDNCDVPLIRLLDVLPIDVSSEWHPLFQILLGLDLSGSQQPLLADDLDDKNFPYDLALFLDQVSLEKVSCHIRYQSDLFTREDIALFAESFDALLGAIANDPGQQISGINLLSERQREETLVQWNQTEQEFPRSASIHSLFEREAARVPDAIAVFSQSESVTYADLNRRANQLAHFILGRNISRGSCVAIFMARSIDMIVSMLAVMKAGMAYLPLDPLYPAQRLEAMLEDSQAALVLADAEVREAMLINEREIVRIDMDASDIAWMLGINPSVEVTSTDLAYVIYTSGSTGRPKGIAIEHHSAVSLLTWGHSTFTAQELQRVLASTSICFDLSVFEIFLPLSVGGAVVLAADILELARIPASSQPTLINTVPSALSAFIHSQKIPESVLCVNLAGEPLPDTLIEQIEMQVPAARIFDLYGPTETTTYSTFARRGNGRPANIGRPLANTKIFLLDARNHPVPIGVPGQIFIGGEGVGRGYLLQPQMTDERFMTIEHLPGAGRLYATGDLGRYRPDGSIDYLGRIDHQIKIRGFRIELGEIENILRQHPRIRDAVVILQKDDALGDALVAYVTIASGPVHNNELVSFQKKFLPSYMVSKEIVILESLPITPNGKIDRKALMAMRLSVPLEAPSDAEAVSEMEKELLNIWGKNFKRKTIGVNDDFFALGGHSLLAFQIFNDIEKNLKVSLMLSVLFKAPTVRLLAREVSLKSQVPRSYAHH